MKIVPLEVFTENCTLKLDLVLKPQITARTILEKLKRLTGEGCICRGGVYAICLGSNGKILPDDIELFSVVQKGEKLLAIMKPWERE